MTPWSIIRTPFIALITKETTKAIKDNTTTTLNILQRLLTKKSLTREAFCLILEPALTAELFILFNIWIYIKFEILYYPIVFFIAAPQNEFYFLMSVSYRKHV